MFSLSSGLLLRLQLAGKDDWGFHMVACTGSFLLCPREAVQNPTLLQAGAARLVDTLFEINSSPDRLDLSADNARRATAADVLISISTDSHSTDELDLIRCGIDQGRRAGLEKSGVLNCLPWAKLQRLFRR